MRRHGHPRARGGAAAAGGARRASVRVRARNAGVDGGCATAALVHRRRLEPLAWHVVIDDLSLLLQAAAAAASPSRASRSSGAGVADAAARRL